MKSTVLVLDPADTYNLITLDDALLELQISDPTDNDKALIEKHIAGVSAAIAKYCDRVFPAERVEETLWDARDIHGFGRGPYVAFPFHHFRQHGHNSLYLKRWPIISIDSVYVDDVALTSDSNDASLRIDRDNGVLYNLRDGFPARWHFGKSVVATYTGGYETIPEDLQRIAIRWVEMSWFAAGQDVTVRSEQVYGIASVTYGNSGSSTSKVDDVPDEIKLLLEPYIRQWAFA
jgi:hypothetical protein